MSISNLRKKSAEKFENLNAQIANLNKGYDDPDKGKFWKPTVDKAENGSAVIRFLPAPENEDFAFVRLWNHSFQNEKNKRWYIENSRTTIGEEDPLSEYNKKLWVSGKESDKDWVRKNSKRRLNYISNIYVISDKKNPETEGKVFLYSYGQKVFDKISAAMNPEFDNMAKFNPFDFWEGADFFLRMKKKEGFRNYDDSAFGSPSHFKGVGEEPMSDEELEKIYNSLHSLDALIAEDRFKSYEELSKRLYYVLDIKNKETSSSKNDDENEYDSSDNNDAADAEEEDIDEFFNNLESRSGDDDDEIPF